MNKIAIIVCLGLITLIPAAGSFAEDKLRSDIDPFSSPAPSRTEEADSAEESEKGIGSFLPKLSFSQKSEPKRPTMLQKMNRNTKQMMQKSKNVLMPWTRQEEPSGQFTGLKQKPEKKKNFFAELLKPFPDKSEPVTTADDWFRQAKPTR